MLSGACVEREQIIVCAYDRVSYNDLGVGLVASSCGGSRPEHYLTPVSNLTFLNQAPQRLKQKVRLGLKRASCFSFAGAVS